MMDSSAYIYETDASDLTVGFNKLKYSETNNKKITLNAVLIKTIVEGIKAAPEVNAHVSYNKWLSTGHVKIIDSIDINMPILLSDSRMLVVKLPDSGNKSLEEITMYLDRLMNKANNTNIDIALLKVTLEDTKKQIQMGNLFNIIGRLVGAVFGKNKLRSISRKEKEQCSLIKWTQCLKNLTLYIHGDTSAIDG